jgi:hypothetical protein
MKKTIIVLVATVFSLASYAQSDRYAAFMKKNLDALDSANSPEMLLKLANDFERVAQSEKTAWQPAYHAAYSLVMRAFNTSNTAEIDPSCDKADALLAQAEAITGPHSEISTLRAMVLQARMRVDGSRGMSMGPKATQILAEALLQKPAGNPRALMQMSQMKFYTPEAFGGSRTAAIDMLKKSIAAYDGFVPADEFGPRWGKQYAIGLLKEWQSDN